MSEIYYFYNNNSEKNKQNSTNSINKDYNG